MVWVWEQCQDQYGNCIRQYIKCITTLVVLIFSIICTAIFWKSYRPLLRFQLIPLSINIITTLSFFCLTIVAQNYSEHLIMLIIQIYSYSIFTYTYTSIYYRSNKKQELKNKDLILKIIDLIFVGLSLITVISSILLGVFSKSIICYDQQGYGTIILLSLYLPIYIITIYYITKTRAKIKSQLSSQYTEQHLLKKQDDQYIQIKLKEGILIIIFLTLSLFLHIIELFIYYLVGQDIQCIDNYLRVTSLVELLLLAIQDIAEIIPHISIPLIWVLLPICYNRRAATIYISNNAQKEQITDQSNLLPGLESQQKIRRRLGHYDT